MTTFSQACDVLIAETARRDLVASIPTWMNQTIRDVHAIGVGGAQAMPVRFAANLVEAALTAGTDNAYVWPIPNQTRHQFLIAAYYPDQDKYAHLTTPGTINIDTDAVDAAYTVYRSGDNYVFDGYGQTGSEIDVAYYEYPKRLVYYPNDATRPCSYDVATESFSYNPPYSADVLPNNKAQAQYLCTNWLLQRWEDLIMQGTRAKLYNRTDDTTRAKASYSMYMEQRPVMVAAESMEFIGFYRR